jgi:hypothetical protein
MNLRVFIYSIYHLEKGEIIDYHLSIEEDGTNAEEKAIRKFNYLIAKHAL